MNVLALTTLLLIPLAALHAADARRPNIILFLIDDQDKASLGAYGGKTFTPNLDRLAVEGNLGLSQPAGAGVTPGSGPVVAPTAQVSVCYMGVNGRDGSVFDSSYERGEAADFPLTGVVPGFQKAIAGQKVGSTVAVAMISADGYPNGQPRAGIEPGDSLVFAIKILGVS